MPKKTLKEADKSRPIITKIKITPSNKDKSSLEDSFIEKLVGNNLDKAVDGFIEKDWKIRYSDKKIALPNFKESNQIENKISKSNSLEKILIKATESYNTESESNLHILFNFFYVEGFKLYLGIFKKYSDDECKLYFQKCIDYLTFTLYNDYNKQLQKISPIIKKKEYLNNLKGSVQDIYNKRHVKFPKNYFNNDAVNILMDNEHFEAEINYTKFLQNQDIFFNKIIVLIENYVRNELIKIDKEPKPDTKMIWVKKINVDSDEVDFETLENLYDELINAKLLAEITTKEIFIKHFMGFAIKPKISFTKAQNHLKYLLDKIVKKDWIDEGFQLPENKESNGEIVMKHFTYRTDKDITEAHNYNSSRITNKEKVKIIDKLIYSIS